MDPIWRTLTKELILAVIDWVSDDEDLGSWLQATRGDRLLQHAVMARYWTQWDISDDCEGDQQNRYWPHVQRLVQEDHGLRPAKYLKSIRTVLNARKQYGSSGEPWIPDSECLKAALGALVPHLTALEAITMYGPPSKVVLPSFSSIGLAIKRIEVDSYFEKPATGAGGDLSDALDDGSVGQCWLDLSPFSNLSILDLTLVTEKEWIGLPQQISGLHALKTLKLAAFYMDLPWVESGVGPNGDLSPLIVPFSGTDNLLGELPSSLRQLTIRDLIYTGEDRLRIPSAQPQTDEHRRGPALEVLSMELTERTNTPNVLSWFPAAELKRLSFSPAPYRASTSPEDFSAAIELVDDVVDKHKNTLQQVILTNALMMCPHLPAQFNSTWAGRFEITDLILNEWQWPQDDTCQYSHESYAPSEDSTQELKHILFGCKLDISRWGSRIQRIRLELPLSSEIEFDMHFPLSEFDLPLLRILIITPRSAGDNVSSAPIIENILKNATQELKYISFCSVAYWIDHGLADHDRNAWQTLPWANAAGGADHRVRSEISSWLSKDDKEFIDGHSNLNKDRENWEDPGSVIQCYLQLGNFVVARRC